MDTPKATADQPVTLPFASPNKFVKIDSKGVLALTVQSVAPAKRFKAMGPSMDRSSREFQRSIGENSTWSAHTTLPNYNDLMQTILGATRGERVFTVNTLSISADVAAIMYATDLLQPYHFTTADYSGSPLGSIDNIGANLGTLTDPNIWWQKNGMRIIVTLNPDSHITPYMF